MFKKKEKVDITHGTPEFSVRYVGKTQTYQAGGRGCTRAPVQHIWDNAQEEKYLKRVNMMVTPGGIILQDLENKKKETKFTIHDISYCCAEPGVHERIFTWISKDKEAKRLDCHAVLCASKEKAQAVAMVLSRAFHMAYKDWKNDKEKSARLKNGKLADASSLSGSTSGRVSRSGSDVSRASSSDKSMETAMHNMTIASGSKDDDFFIVNNVVIESNSNGNNNTKPAMPEP